MKIALTGSSGPLGRIIRENLTLSGHEVIGCSRHGGDGDISIDVLTANPDLVVQQVDGVVYGAWDSSDRSLTMQMRHANSAKNWATACQRLDRPFIFLSTTLAFSGSLSHYGQAKYSAEREILLLGGTVLRIGLVCDDSYSLLSTSIRRSKFVKLSTLIFRNLRVFPVSSSSVCKIVIAACNGNLTPNCYWAASKDPKSIDQILRYPHGKNPKLKEYSYSKKMMQGISIVNRHVPNVDRIIGLLDTAITMPLDSSYIPNGSLENWADQFSP